MGPFAQPQPPGSPLLTVGVSVGCRASRAKSALGPGVGVVRSWALRELWPLTSLPMGVHHFPSLSCAPDRGGAKMGTCRHFRADGVSVSCSLWELGAEEPSQRHPQCAR